MILTARSDLPLDKDEHSRFLPWLIAFMVFLSILAVAGMLVLNATASRWDIGVRGNLTIQVVPTDDAAVDEARLNELLTVLATTPEVARYDALDETRLISLLEPWVGLPATAGHEGGVIGALRLLGCLRRKQHSGEGERDTSRRKSWELGPWAGAAVRVLRPHRSTSGPGGVAAGNSNQTN